MSSIVTGTVTGLVDNGDVLNAIGDTRREAANGFGDTRRELAFGVCDVNKTTSSEARNTVARIEANADRIVDQSTQYFIAGQNINFQNATALAALKASTDAQNAAVLASIQLAQSQNATATAAASAATQMLLVQESVKTRELLEKNLVDELRAQLARSQVDLDRHHERNYGRDGFGGRGRGDGCCDKDPVKFNFGPPLGAQVSVKEG